MKLQLLVPPVCHDDAVVVSDRELILLLVAASHWFRCGQSLAATLPSLAEPTPATRDLRLILRVRDERMC